MGGERIEKEEREGESRGEKRREEFNEVVD